MTTHSQRCLELLLLAATVTATAAETDGNGPRASAQRLEQRLQALGRFGANPAGGVSRVAYSEADSPAAIRHVADARGRARGAHRRGRQHHRTPRRHGSGVARDHDGSHIDSVPKAAISTATLVSRCDRSRGTAARARHCDATSVSSVVVFTDEEGGVVGSQAMAGRSRPGNARGRQPQRAHGPGWDPHLGRRSCAPRRGARAPGALAAFVELHIEQGAVLDEAGIDIGVVEGIVGIRWWDVTVEGTANHAGTTPMNRRRDALLAASELALAVNRVASTMPARRWPPWDAFAPNRAHRTSFQVAS